jgi:hypothetical protein
MLQRVSILKIDFMAYSWITMLAQNLGKAFAHFLDLIQGIVNVIL